ncbi:GNAT family protein [Pseudoalteromonas sp. L1]|uniref:GNAT family N-acetyltransferase n=1 Tax=Pseudoalteromonas sp. L1 TaxID=195716 RepID=UPI001F25D37C|nr:GNAT family N-acetyltransferase [Pseudoalteromonas sp. L1]
MKFEALTKSHVSKLLDFELKNREWFESYISPRPNDFYSHSGVNNHIDSLLNQINSGNAFCGVILKYNVIVARANLKNISDQSAYVGYRVGKDFTSQGVATYCLEQLIDIGKSKLNLKQLNAQVLNNNPTSMHILHKFGFEAVSTTPNFIKLNNKQLSCTELILKYA